MILVIGATGMVGGMILRRLTEAGAQPVGLSRHPPADSGSADWIAAVVAQRCPNAVRCADPFHVVKWATDALDEGRSTPITNRAAAAWLAELRAFTLYARASHQFNTATAPVLDELHTIALRDVVPSMNLPQGSEAAARLTERLTALQAEITAAQTPTPTADPQPPAPAPTTTGPTLD